MTKTTTDAQTKNASTTTRKILIALDGSPYSANCLHYVTQLFKQVGDIEFHLFSLISTTIPDTQLAWINEDDPKSALNESGRRQYDVIEHCMREAMDKFQRQGIGKHQVKKIIKLARTNVANELLRGARSGVYDAILIGRRGLGMIQEMVMGSVSKTILQKCHDVPIWLTDGLVDSRKFLAPVDGTVHSMKAVDHLAFILGGNPHAEITLFNSPQMFAGKSNIDPTDFIPIWGQVWCDDHLGRPDSLFHAPEQLLRESGFSMERVHRLETSIGLYPSRQIVRQALIDDFGTIVMGRRPADASKGMFGGVTDKVLAMAEQVAIWIVG